MKITIKSLIIVGSLACAASMSSAADVAENWAKYCASCHGKDGAGKTVMGKKSGVEDYTDAKAQAKFTDQEAFTVIQNGKDKMKGFKDRLSDDEIKALVAHIRSFKK